MKYHWKKRGNGSQHWQGNISDNLNKNKWARRSIAFCNFAEACHQSSPNWLSHFWVNEATVTGLLLLIKADGLIENGTETTESEQKNPPFGPQDGSEDAIVGNIWIIDETQHTSNKPTTTICNLLLVEKRTYFDLAYIIQYVLLEVSNVRRATNIFCEWFTIVASSFSGSWNQTSKEALHQSGNSTIANCTRSPTI